jgi:hypothetical protein
MHYKISCKQLDGVNILSEVCIMINPWQGLELYIYFKGNL